MQSFLHLIKIESKFTANACPSPLEPFIKDLGDSHYSRGAVDKDIEIARESIFKLCKPEELCHELLVIGTAFAVDRYLKTVQVSLITDVCDLFCLTALYEIRYVVDDGFNACGIRDLRDLYKVLCLIHLVLGSYGKSSLARIVDGFHLVLVIKDLSAARKVRCRHYLQQIGIGIPQISFSSSADFSKIE